MTRARRIATALYVARTYVTCASPPLWLCTKACMRMRETATLLPAGKVLQVGGQNSTKGLSAQGAKGKSRRTSRK